MKWISIKEKFPLNGSRILVTDGKNLGYIMEFEYDIERSINGIPDSNSLAMNQSDITHWIPLPEPPKNKVSPCCEFYEELCNCEDKE